MVRERPRWLAPTTVTLNVAGLDPLRLAWLSIGLAMALYLVWAELYRIHAICLWCTGVHVLSFLLWITVLFGQILSGPAHDRARTGGRAGR